jgi:hypothetical protein
MTSTKPSIALAALAVAVATAPDDRQDDSTLHGLTIGALRDGVRTQDFVTSFVEVAHAARGGSFVWV